MRTEQIHVWHLEYLGDAHPERQPRRFDLRRADPVTPEFARYLYNAVGAPWLWYARNAWTWQHWYERLSDPRVHIHVAFAGAQPLGYFELEQQTAGSVEVCYFGLVPEFIGKGHGRELLEDAIREAKKLGQRVWLHTCTLDHEHALANYQARGFTVFREEDVSDTIPVEIQPWPGADRPRR